MSQNILTYSNTFVFKIFHKKIIILDLITPESHYERFTEFSVSTEHYGNLTQIKVLVKGKFWRGP